MNKNALIALGVIGIGLVLWFALGNTSMAPTTDMPGGMMRGNETAQNRIVDGSSSLRELLGLGQSLKCSFSSSAEEMKSEGTTYISGDRMRTDVTTTGGPEGMNRMAMLFDGDMTYTWDMDKKEGMKMMMPKPNPDQQTDTSMMDMSGMGDTRFSDIDQKYEYSCEAWSADDATFTPPTDVTFMDHTKMMEDMGAMMGGMKTSAGAGADASVSPPQAGGMNMCAMCDQAPDAESKAQCLAAMGCQ